jgi:hypothetical protein
MCDLGPAHDHQHFGFLVDTPEIRALIAETQRLTTAIPDAAARVDALRPSFGALLASEGWLPDSCAKPESQALTTAAAVTSWSSWSGCRMTRRGRAE